MLRSAIRPSARSCPVRSRKRHWFRPAAAIVALGVLLAAAPVAALAQEAEEADPYSIRNLFKTATYQSLSAFDDFLFGWLFGGGVAAGGVLFAVSVTTEPFIYYAHESAWTALAPRTGEAEMELIPYKTATFTMANMGRVFMTGWALTGSPAVAAGFVAFNAFGDAAAYALNDVGWVYFSPIPEPAPSPGAAVRKPGG